MQLVFYHGCLETRESGLSELTAKLARTMRACILKRNGQPKLEVRALQKYCFFQIKTVFSKKIVSIFYGVTTAINTQIMGDIRTSESYLPVIQLLFFQFLSRTYQNVAAVPIRNLNLIYLQAFLLIDLYHKTKLG